MKERKLEPGIHTDLERSMSYSDYLGLDQILTAQRPLSEPEHHDEMLFLIMHQTAELWFKQILHEVHAAIRHLQQDALEPCLKILSRVKLIQQILFEQWGILATLTPTEYAEFRHVLGNASGFQSPLYRELEFVMGNKNASYLNVYKSNQKVATHLSGVLHQPSLYDEFQLYLKRQGFPIDAQHLQRNWADAYEAHDSVTKSFKLVYEDSKKYWDAYAMCEKLVDVEESFQLWRFRHMKTVERIIGFKQGTGGSSGVNFLKKALDLKFFPELIAVRTDIG
ncbi:MAG: tryptophan 2,3-dioxygenase [Gammaproteobacteria bacterium]|nr:tryptophan 2,3-dioxygenase [Gammaproteobacteria bacterium]NNC97988.1 tryptophan 2,3-dioxygenase [Gammaproteobacteria bacterium]NNM12800.1 tryptophan 2,3-dioxygenase [Gammaproteobacteria bacterium]